MSNTEDIEGTLDNPTDEGTDVQQSKEKSGTTGKDWQASYKGLQALYNKLKKSHDELEAKYAAVVQSSEETNLQVTNRDKQLEVLQTELGNLKTQIQSLEGEKAKTEGRVTRAQLIMAKYPELAEFEADGLLPSADTQEELEQAFQKFREKLLKQGVKLERQKTAGAPPDTDLSNKSQDIDEGEDYVWEQMIASAGRDAKEFSKWQAKYDAILAAKEA